MCHLQQIDSCFLPMAALKAEAGEIITSEPGINKFCSTVSTSVSCLKSYLRRCSTPLQRELFNFFTEQFSLRVDEFCNSTSLKQQLLAHSPCIQSNVFTSREYQSTCVNDLLAAFNSGRNLVTRRFADPGALISSSVSESTDIENKIHTSDSLLDISCCGFNRFSSCFQERVERFCGKEAVAAINFFTSRTFGIGMDRMCPISLFSHESPTCKSILPMPGTEPNFGDLKDNPLGKYVMQYLGFLFDHPIFS